MILETKPLGGLDAADLQALLTDEVAEGRTLDFKLDVNWSGGDEKREFLADVSSLANTAGGFLVIGVAEEQSVATAVPGVSIQDPDSYLQRIENILRDGLSPRLPSVDIVAVPIAAGRHVVVISVGRSWNGPHMVSGNGRFYLRNSIGKYPMDVDELRDGFLRSATTRDRLERFRRERVLGRPGGLPVSLESGPATYLHLLPLGMFSNPSVIDMSSLRSDVAASLHPLYGGVRGSRHNFDGFVTFDTVGATGEVHSYLQLFRSGAVETASTLLISGSFEDAEKAIPSITFEAAIEDELKALLNTQKELGVAPPIVAYLTLCDVEGRAMAGVSRFPGSSVLHRFDRPDLLVPEVVVEDWSVPVEWTAKQLMDPVWQSSGFQQSPLRGPDGMWLPENKRR